MDRRRFLVYGSSVSLAGGLSGCISNVQSQNTGRAVDAVEIINIDDKNHDFHVALSNSSGETMYEKTIALEGAPRNEYTRKVLHDIPSEPAVAARATIENRSTREQIPTYDLSPFRLSVMCSSNGNLGITVFK